MSQSRSTVNEMSQEWMLDVLADLRQYALKNYYLGLAEQLDDAIVVAAVEIRAHETLAKSEAEADDGIRLSS